MWQHFYNIICYYLDTGGCKERRGETHRVLKQLGHVDSINNIWSQGTTAVVETCNRQHPQG